MARRALPPRRAAESAARAYGRLSEEVLRPFPDLRSCMFMDGFDLVRILFSRAELKSRIKGNSLGNLTHRILVCERF